MQDHDCDKYKRMDLLSRHSTNEYSKDMQYLWICREWLGSEKQTKLIFFLLRNNFNK